MNENITEEVHSSFFKEDNLTDNFFSLVWRDLKKHSGILKNN